jgi:serine/threonine protein kinase
MEKVQKGVYNFSGREWNTVSDEAKAFIRKLLEYNPAQRLSAEEALNDPWMKNTASQTVIDRPLAINALQNLKNFQVSF